MNPTVKVLIIMNNYFHDVATAMLFSSALILWLLARHTRASGGGRRWLAGAYALLTRVAWFSIAWIVVGGIPRTAYFNQVEWNLADPSNKYLFTALMIKHAVMWIAVASGVVMWVRVSRLIKSGETEGDQ